MRGVSLFDRAPISQTPPLSKSCYPSSAAQPKPGRSKTSCCPVAFCRKPLPSPSPNYTSPTSPAKDNKMPRHTFTPTPLFGGALTVDLPSNFADVSKLRQVPDNQEVYIDKDGFTSIVIDITERVSSSSSSSSSSSDSPDSALERDAKALTTHLEELVGVEDAAETVQVWNTTETQISHFEDIPAYTLIATQKPKQREGERAGAPDFTALILTLIRLEKEQTDILITINVPHIKGEYDEEEIDLAMGKQGELIGDAVEYAARIWESFEVRDWGLFSEI
ncbi:hypothetical protein B0T21DRAFT_51927 [Apiosordaria backusii]|uniref:Uncharacterized protein n=1 Tax=Apiosordaria backusii TaxID=314023 RepID=A0AA40E1F4_9PEZI|nr:hypothetical protein B0T21DRAFT_51927 [Apiosordaria backusii]